MSSAILMYDSREQDKWSGMVILSVAVHLAVFSTFFLVPEDPPLGLSDKEIVYEVDLVDPSELNLNTKAAGKQVIDSSNLPDSSLTKRIYTPKQEKTLTIAKKTVTKKPSMPKKKEISSGQLLDRAISRIKTKVDNEDGNYLDKALSDLDIKASQPGRAGTTGGVADRFYKMQVETWIKNNWAYPVARGDSDKLEAIIVIKVNQDGTILDTRFIKRSKDNLFDKSVLQAIEKSRKVPPLPKGFRKSYEEIEINFNLKDLE
ncbi:energy transducer TonB [Thermodesulfobacteriota bacterium]